MGLKVLVIAAVVALLLLLVYTKLYPYLQVLKKIVGVAKAVVEPQAGRRGTGKSVSANNQSKLVRCVRCGTWVPRTRHYPQCGPRYLLPQEFWRSRLQPDTQGSP